MGHFKSWIQILRVVFFTLFIISLNNSVCAGEQVTIQLKWRHQFQFAGYYAAKEKGFYANEGLDVTLMVRNASELNINPVRTVLDNDAQYGISDSGLILERMKGRPVVLLAQIFQRSPFIFISKRNSGIISPYEAVGKKVMIDTQNSSYAPLLAMLLETIGGVDMIEIIPPSFDYKDLKTGKADLMAAYLTNQPYTLKQQGMILNIINPQNYGIDFYGDNLFTTESEVKNHPGRVEKMIRATLKGWDYALKHSEEIIDLILKKYDPELSRDHLLYEAKMIDQMIIPELIPIGEVLTERYDWIAETYARLGMAKRDYDLTGFFYSTQTAENKITLTQEEQTWLDEHPSVQLSAGNNLPPYSIVDKNGIYKGMDADLLGLIEQKTGLVFNIKPEPWPDAILRAMRHETYGISTAAVTEERKKHLIFSQSYNSFPSAVYVREDAPGYRNITDLNEKTIAVMAGSANVNFFKETYPRIKILEVESILESLTAVIEGRADGSWNALAAAENLIFKHSLPSIKPAFVYFPNEDEPGVAHIGIRNDQPILLSIINKGISAITKSELQQIRGKWLNNISGIPVIREPISIVTRQEQTWLKSKGNLTFGVLPAPRPFQYKNEDGMPIGLTRDYIQMLGKRLDITTEVSELPDRPAIPSKEGTNEPDVFSGLTRTTELTKVLKFTKPYSSVPIVLVTLKSVAALGELEYLKSETMGIIRKYGIDKIAGIPLSDLPIVYYNTLEAALTAVSEGEIFGVLGDINSVDYHIRRHDFENLKVNATTPYTYDLAFAVRKSKPELFSILNKVLLSFTENENILIHDKWMYMPVERKTDWSLLVTVIFGITAIALVVIFVFFKWNRRLFHEVDKRKRLEKVLKEREERLSLAMQGANDGLWDFYPLTGKVYFSPRWKSMLGYEDDELENSIATWENLLAPEDKDKTLETLENYLKGKTEHYRSEFRMCHKDGTYRHILSRAFSRIDAKGKITRLVGTHVDVTELKLVQERLRKQKSKLTVANKALQESKDRLSLAAESGGLGMWEWHVATGDFIVTDKWLELAGLSQEEYLARYSPLSIENFLKYIHPDDQEQVHSAIETYFNGETDLLDYAYRFESSDKGWIWLSVVGRVIERDADGAPVRMVGFQQDITDRKKAEISLQENQIHLQKYANTQATLLQEVNHRVKNNLTTIIGMLHIEEDRVLTQDDKGYLSPFRMLENRVVGLLTVHSLLSANRWEPLELSTLCKEVVSQSIKGFSIPERLNLEVESCHHKVNSDMAHHLALILNELATNTIKHGGSAQGLVEIKIFFEEKAKDTVCMIYADKGPGFPQKVLNSEIYEHSIGIEMTNSVVQSNMRGQIKRYNDDGAVTRICFPLKNNDIKSTMG